jgi:hypothetical protein
VVGGFRVNVDAALKLGGDELNHCLRSVHRLDFADNLVQLLALFGLAVRRQFVERAALVLNGELATLGSLNTIAGGREGGMAPSAPEELRQHATLAFWLIDYSGQREPATAGTSSLGVDASETGRLQRRALRPFRR